MMKGISNKIALLLVVSLITLGLAINVRASEAGTEAGAGAAAGGGAGGEAAGGAGAGGAAAPGMDDPEMQVFKGNPEAAAATIGAISADAFSTFAVCSDKCQGSEVCINECLGDQLPKTPEEEKKYLKIAKDTTKGLFCIVGCQANNECETIQDQQKKEECDLTCANFCGGFEPTEDFKQSQQQAPAAH